MASRICHRPPDLSVSRSSIEPDRNRRSQRHGSSAGRGRRHHRDGAGRRQVKLQKLLYYAQGWLLAWYREPLFTDAVEAWAWGPASPLTLIPWTHNPPV